MSPFTKGQKRQVDAFYKEFGKRIRAYRKKKGMYAQDLAEKIGVERQTIYNIEVGSTKFSLHTAYLISIALDVPIHAFFPSVISLFEAHGDKR